MLKVFGAALAVYVGLCASLQPSQSAAQKPVIKEERIEQVGPAVSPSGWKMLRNTPELFYSADKPWDFEGKRRVWTQVTYMTAQADMGKSYFSVARLFEFDCPNRSVKVLDDTYYRDRAINGPVVARNENLSGVDGYPPSNSFADITRQYACPG